LGATQVSGSEGDTWSVTPEAAGLERAGDLDALRGGSPEENARTLAGILRGEITGPRRDIVLLNAAAGFVVAGLSADLGAGVERAREAIGSGKAWRILERVRA
ncbi:MAG: anthranilate phosphoribosyltransferase, partial [Gluconacetobacter diazotrophicus]|nr:anthranilate phosphoribosyltransferase [Gluconacetobacter diazotrophicus]